jgi:hypothetical protein
MIPSATSFYYRSIMLSHSTCSFLRLPAAPRSPPAPRLAAAISRCTACITEGNVKRMGRQQPPPLHCKPEGSCETYHCMYPALMACLLLLRQCALFVIRILIYKQTNTMGLSFSPDAKKTCYKIVETSKSSGFGVNLGFVKVSRDRSKHVTEVYQKVNCK